MKLQGKFFYKLGGAGIFVKWQGVAEWWDADEAGDGYWDLDVGVIEMEMIGFTQTMPLKLTEAEIDSDVWELINERALKELGDELAAVRYEQKAADLENSFSIPWPSEVNF